MGPALQQFGYGFKYMLNNTVLTRYVIEYTHSLIYHEVHGKLQFSPEEKSPSDRIHDTIKTGSKLCLLGGGR